MQRAWDGPTLRVALATIGVSALIAILLTALRAAVGNPFELGIFRHLLLFQDYYALAPFMAVAAAALYPPIRAVGMHVARICGEHISAVALASAAALSLGAFLVVHQQPLSLDEYAVVFQARVFAEGHLTAHYPQGFVDWLIPKFLQGRFLQVYRDGQVLSLYWPGFSLLLTPFAAIGMPWLLNPLISGATLVVLHRLALRLFGDAASAGYVVLFTLASPVIAIDGMSYYTMPAHLLFNALFTLLLLDRTPARAFAAGLVGSWALVLHNPVPHMLYALPWIGWLLLQPRGARLLAALAAGYLPVSLAIGWGWAFYIDHVGSRASVEAIATPAAAADLFVRRLTSMLGFVSREALFAHLLHLVKIWLWAMPGLIVMAAVGLWGARRDRGPWLALAASVLLTYFGYFLVRFDQGHGWGSRYFHSAWLALPLLAVAGMRSLSAKNADSPDRARSTLPAYLAGCAFLSLVALTGLRAVQVERFIARHLAQAPSAPSGEARVLIVDPRSGYYAWDLVQNDPLLRNRVLMLSSRGAQNDRAMMAARFPQYRLLSEDRRGSAWGPPSP